MLKALLKKQLTEVFRSYFYDAKKNRMRSKWAIAGWIVFFVVIMVGVLGGMFTALSLTLCGPLTNLGMGWLYFLLLGVIAIVLGAFGSVFNTYSGLYLAKDNDLLLSMPIPVRTIMAARLMNVYLMGSMYAATVLLPAVIVYWAVAGVTVARVICGVLLILVVTVIVLLLSCLLGWGVAKISLRLKNRSFVTVLLALGFIAAYYFFYFKAAELVRDIIQNAQVYGERIRGASRTLYLFGRIGEGDWTAAAICTAVTALLFALMWFIMSRSFTRIATSGGVGKRARYVEKKARPRSVFGALLAKEFGRFTSSANYMLNCALGVLLIPAGGAVLLYFGERDIFSVLNSAFPVRTGSPAVLLCTMLCMLSSMNDVSAPSISLEGKSLWIPQSLPVEPKTVLRAKTAMQLLLTEIPMLFSAVCAAVVLPGSTALKLLVCVTPLLYVAFMSLFGTFVGLRMPLLNWTEETAPIKQSGSVTLALFGSWGFCAVLAGLYLLIGYRIGPVPYLLIWSVLYAAAAVFLQRWLDTEGGRQFAELS